MISRAPVQKTSAKADFNKPFACGENTSRARD
jgi:hypothetical protein